MIRRHHVAFAVAASLTVACAGMLTRDNVAEPALASVWQRVRTDAVSELDASPNPDITAALAQADAAVQTGDELRMAAVPWQLLLSTAQAGIDRAVQAGAMHPGVAASLTERVKQFGLTVNEYLRVNKP
jgi:hypothetical protein